MPEGRKKLVRVLSVAGDVIRVDDVVSAFQLDRTAAEHWDLTEQIFKDILVMTGRAPKAPGEARYAILVETY